MTSDEFQQLLKIILEVKDVAVRNSEIAVRNSVVLEEHARRSAASEQRLELQEEKIGEMREHFDTRLDPIEDHIKFVSWLVKGAVGLLTLAGVIAGIVEVVRHF